MLTIKGLHNVPQISAPCDLPKTLAEIIKKRVLKLLMATLFALPLKSVHLQKIILLI